jgi:probable F420-dependent oxidoreductase
MGKLALGQAGVALNVSDSYLDEAVEVEQLGYSAVWLPGGQLDTLGRLADVVSATTTVAVGSAIVSLDAYSAEKVTGLCAQVEAAAPGRLVVGLGGPQKPRPLRALNGYLDHLDQADPPVLAQRRLLAALGPRKLELARDRAAGAILLLVTPAYIGAARRILGDESTLVVDQMLVLDSDAARARETARRHLRFLSGLRGYRASFARMGFTETDIAGISDQLVDDLVIWGDEVTVGGRLTRQLRSGADHVILHVLSEGSQPGPIDAARALIGNLPR